MAKTRRTIEDKLAALDAIRQGETVENENSTLKKALTDRNNRVVAKAATVSAEKLNYDLIPDLLAAYERFLVNPGKTDKTCAAKRAIGRALYELDYHGTDFYLGGLRYRQSEPVWGGSVDTAVELRCTCAIGLASTTYPRAVLDLIELLHDPEAQARVGAVRAISLLAPYDAEIALRSKILQSDEEPEVIGECFSALLKIESEFSLPFVAAFLNDPRDDIREMAALSLGESRLDDAFASLKSCWQRVFVDNAFRNILLRAMVLHRSHASFDFLLSIIEKESLGIAINTLEALSIYRHNQELRDQIKQRVNTRTQPEVEKAFERYWG